MRLRTWFHIHSYIAMFFLPLAIAYAVTGGVELLTPDDHHGYGRGFEGGRVESGEHGGRQEEAGVYSRLLRLHRGEGGVITKVLGVTFASALVVIYFSGIWVCWHNRQERRRMLITAVVGLVVAVVVIAID